MGTGYQEKKKEQYEKMMEEIAAHPDFGKRNPVDIGVECGYQEEAVMEMICFLQGNKDEQGTGAGQSTKKKTESRQKEERDKYYFLKGGRTLPLHFGLFNGRKSGKSVPRYENTESTKRKIIAVDIHNWKIEQIKEVEKPFLFRIKDAIYAWVDSESRTKLKWENLESKDHGEFNADSNIWGIIITEDGIAAVTQESFVLFRFQGETKRASLGVKGNSMLLEGRDAFYIIAANSKDGITGSQIWKIEKCNFRKKIIFDNPGVRVFTAESSDDGLKWYGFGGGRLRLYLEDSLPNFTTVSAAYLLGNQIKYYGYTEGISTKNYKLLCKRIRKKNGKKCFDFNRQMSDDICSNQVVGIYEKDIFIGVNESGSIIKIDLNKDRAPVVLG